MLLEYPILLCGIAIAVAYLSYLIVKGFSSYLDDGRKPYLTQNIYALGPLFLAFAFIVIANLGFLLFSVGGLFAKEFSQNNFENVANKIKLIDENIENPNLSLNYREYLSSKRNKFIDALENGDTETTLKAQLEVDYEDLYGPMIKDKSLNSLVDEALNLVEMGNKNVK